LKSITNGGSRKDNVTFVYGTRLTSLNTIQCTSPWTDMFLSWTRRPAPNRATFLYWGYQKPVPNADRIVLSLRKKFITRQHEW